MNFLPSRALAEVRDYDFANHTMKGGNNTTRFYLYLLPAGEDMEIHTVACKADRRGNVTAKEVVRASVDDPKMRLLDIGYHGMAGYVVDWSPQKLGRPRPWDYKGKWGLADYARHCLWKLHRPVVNPEALISHPRFRYCQWAPEHGHILDYLKVYVKHPRIELLAKAGLGRLGNSVSLAAQLERDKGLARFIMEHRDEIRKMRYGIDAIRRAYRRGVSLLKASESIDNRRRLSRLGLPAEIDADKAMAYIRRSPYSEVYYCEYVRYCRLLGLDLQDTKNAFPRNLRQRRQVVCDQVDEMRRREREAEAKKRADFDRKRDSLIAAAAAKWANCVRSHNPYRIVFPRKTDDFVREGRRLQNCLGDGHYAAKMARGDTVVAFVRQARRPSAAFVAVEYSPDQKRVLQCYGAKNAKPSPAVAAFVDRVFGEAVSK